MEHIDENNLYKWLNTDLGRGLTVFDKINDFNDKLQDYLKKNGLTLKYHKNIFLIQLIKYIYYNSIVS